VSTHREIEEVYKEDIMKKQKMTKGIVAESLGELSKMGEEMSELSKEELLKELAYAYGCSTISEQAYKQIKETIQNLP